MFQIRGESGSKAPKNELKYQRQQFVVHLLMKLTILLTAIRAKVQDADTYMHEDTFTDGTRRYE